VNTHSVRAKPSNQNSRHSRCMEIISLEVGLGV
jgi:hypothetical protein